MQRCTEQDADITKVYKPEVLGDACSAIAQFAPASGSDELLWSSELTLVLALAVIFARYLFPWPGLLAVAAAATKLSGTSSRLIPPVSIASPDAFLHFDAPEVLLIAR
jgi:hypothetical protein